MFTVAFWRATTERALKTFAQTEAALLVGAGTGLIDAPWEASLSVAGMAAVVSVLTSVGSDAITGNVSLTGAEIPAGDVVAVVGDKPGLTVAGPASPLANNTPVDVSPA